MSSELSKFFDQLTGEEQRTWRAVVQEIQDLTQNEGGEIRKRHLPITEKERAIRFALENHPVISVEAPPGAGKSIDLGAMVMKIMPDRKKLRIAMTQPRRDAARGVCTAVAARHELEFGKDVCFSTSEFHGNKRDTTLQIQTTGILLNQFHDDPLLKSYEVVIVDEAHERDLNIDLVVGLLKRANRLRGEKGEPPIKIVLASATLDQDKFKHFFDIPPEATIKSRGKMFEVQRQYLPPEGPAKQDLHSGEARARPYTALAVDEVMDILRRWHRGSVLVFMPGKREIEEVRQGVAAALQSMGVNWAEVLTLHGDNKPQERNHVLKGKKRGDGRRRVIISTNIAETSLTVPGVVHVVDSCRKKETVFDPATGLETLMEVPASKAECDQRAGRAGRLEPGFVRRLVTEAEFAALPDHPEPEIKRLDLSSMVLTMIRLGIKDIENFEFVEPPPSENVREALQVLYRLGAITENQELTPLGAKMAKLPVTPRLARVIVAAQELQCLDAAVSVSSLIEGREVFRRPSDFDRRAARKALVEEKQRGAKLKAWAEFASYSSDPHQQSQYIEEIVLRSLHLGNKNPTEEDFGYRIYASAIQAARSILVTKGFISEQGELTVRGRDAALRPLQIPGIQQAESKAREVSLEVNDQEVREYARKALEAKQADMKAEVASDWILYYKVFKRFLEAPNRWQFCEDNGLDIAVLERAEKNYYRVLKELRHSEIDLRHESVASLNEDSLSMAILSAYAPDHLIKQLNTRRGVAFVQLDRGDASVRITSSSVAASEARRPALAVCLKLDAGMGMKTVGRGKKEETEFKYAVGVHPVRASVLHSAIPYLVRRNEQPSGYELDDQGQVFTTYSYQFQTKDKTWVELPQDKVFELSQGAVAVLGRAIAEQSHASVKKDVFQVTENRKTAEVLDRLYHRSRGRLSWKDLATWYADLLGDAISVEEAELLDPKDYQLNVDQVCAPGERQKIEQTAPEQILLGGQEYAVAYQFFPPEPKSSSEERQKDRFRATVDLTLQDLEATYRALMHLDASTPRLARKSIPALQDQDGLRWQVRTTYPTYEEEDLSVIQTKVEDRYLEDGYRAFKPRVVEIPPSVTSLPSLSSLGLVPTPYATRYNGEQVFAYPAFETQRFSGDRVGYVLRYYREKAEADRVNRVSETVQAEREAVRARAQDRETLMDPAIAEYQDALKRIQSLSGRGKAVEREAAWVDYDQVVELTRKVEAARDSLFSSGRPKEDADPAQALKILEEVKVFLAERSRLREAALPELEKLRSRAEGVKIVMEQKFKSASQAQTEYGVASFQYERWQGVWNQITQALNPPVNRWKEETTLPDPAKAKPLLESLETFLAQLAPPVDLEQVDYPSQPETRRAYTDDLSPKANVSSGLGGLAARVEFKDRRREGSKDPSLPPSKPVSPSTPVEKEVMTEQIREELRRELAIARHLLEDTLATLPEFPSGQILTSFQVKQAGLRDTAKKYEKELRGHAKDLESSTDVASSRGVVQSIVAKVERLRQRDYPHIMGGSKEVPARYRQILARIPGIEAAYGVSISPEGLRKASRGLLRLAEGEETINSLQEEIENIVAATLGN